MTLSSLQAMSLECRSLAQPYAGQVIDLREKASARFNDPTDPANPFAMCPQLWHDIGSDMSVRRYAINHPEFVPWQYAYVTPLGITLKSWTIERLWVLVSVIDALSPLIQTTRIVDFSHVYDLRTVGVMGEVSMPLGEATWTLSDGQALTQPYIRLDCGVPLSANERISIALHELAHVADARNYRHPAGHDELWGITYGTVLWLYISIVQPHKAMELVRVAQGAKFPPIFPTQEQAQALMNAAYK